jgi:hypothetical protein
VSGSESGGLENEMNGKPIGSIIDVAFWINDLMENFLFVSSAGVGWMEKEKSGNN